VDQGFDAADDWIVARVVPDDIVITADIPLAARCSSGRMRAGPDRPAVHGLEHRRCAGDAEPAGRHAGRGDRIGRPPPFDARDRSRFLQALDRAIHALRRPGG